MEIEISQKRLDDIATFFDFLFSPAGVIEGFFARPDGTHATRFYDNRNKFIQEVLVFNQRGFTCYAGLQPRNHDLLNGYRAGTDDDVVAVRLLALDLDPVRASGLKANATDHEKILCLAVALEIQNRFINEMGYRPPLLTSSGNGNWVYCRIPEVPVASENKEEIRARLKAWGGRATEIFRFEGARIDAVFDLRRVTKVPGTRIFNHPDEPARPQRVAEILTAGLPEPDQKLKDDFMSIPVAPGVLNLFNIRSGELHYPMNVERMFKKCSSLSFLKKKGESGVSLPHSIRLALASFADRLGDMDKGLAFMRQVIGGCPDFNEIKTRKYLELNQCKSRPYGCAKIRELCSRHFSDFKEENCRCRMKPTRDRLSGRLRKPSPIRWARVKPGKRMTAPPSPRS